MLTKDSSCLQGKEGNSSVAFNHIVCMEDMYSSCSKLRGAQQDHCIDRKWIGDFSVYPLLRIISHRTGESFC